MPLPEKQNQTISVTDAAKLTARYRSNVALGAVKGGAIWKENIEKILNQAGCVALRCYFGGKADNSSVIVFVGVDKNGDDLIDGVLIEDWFPCPPYCSTTNSLTG